MNTTDGDKWKSGVLGFVLEAFAAHEPLQSALIFKGARILNLRLGTDFQRESFDLDSNLDANYATNHPQKEDCRGFLARESELALKKFFSRQDPVRFQLESIKAEVRPPRSNHPLGWSGFTLTIRVIDNELLGVRGVPSVEFQVAAYEGVGEFAVSDLQLSNGLIVRAQTLERIAGEKMRAFLTSLPAYISKIGCHDTPVRVKDLYDLARIRRRCEIADNAFWRTAGREFRLACESRFVDCVGIETFAEDLDATRQIYEREPNLPKDISFDEAWSAAQAAIHLFTGFGIIPFAFPIPEGQLRHR